MRRVVVDTDILSEYLKGYDAIVNRHALEYAREHGVFTFTSVTVHEIVFGLALKSASRQLEQALDWLRRNEEVAPMSSDYVGAALVRADARKHGRTVESADSLIAMIAARLRVPLVTGNTEDFKVIQKCGVALELQNWRQSGSQ